MTVTKTLTGRSFLNRTDSVYDSTVSYTMKNWEEYAEGSFRVSDCFKKINLDLKWETAEEYDNSMYKLNILEGMARMARLDLESMRTAFLSGKAKNETQ